MHAAQSGRTPRRGLLWTIIPLVVVALAAAVGVVIAVQIDDSKPKIPVGIPAQPALIDPNTITGVMPVACRSTTGDASADRRATCGPRPNPAAVAAALARYTGVPALGKLTGSVSDAATGDQLWTRSPAVPMTPASTTKILTAAAALLALPLNATITTNAVQGPDGSIVLVGAGDPTLTVAPTASGSLFTNPPTINDLAAQINKAGITVRSVSVDTGAFSGPPMAPTWETADIAGGSIAPIESLMADSGRRDPLGIYSPRTATPAQDAGEALARALGVPPGTVRQASAPAGAKIVASVRSAPLSQRLVDMMSLSDDVAAETIAIEVAKATGEPASLAGGVVAVKKVLTNAGVDLSGVTLLDTNGLSAGDRIPADVLENILTAAANRPDTATSANTSDHADIAARLRPLLDTLPVAGATGTLADRFGHSSSAASGWVRAKTGTLTGVSTLAGIIQTVDNRVLIFTLMSSGTDPAVARPALDDIASALRNCGCR